MKKLIYFIGGLSGVGKSYFTGKFCDYLNIPRLCTDNIYSLVCQKINMLTSDFTKLMFEDGWDKISPNKFGTMDKCFENAYYEWFDYLLPQKAILEGFSVFNNPRELRILQEMFKNHEKRYVLIQPTYEDWQNNRNKIRTAPEMLQLDRMPCYLSEDNYYKLSVKYRDNCPKQTIIIASENQITDTANGGMGYQKEEVVNVKWSVFDFPKDLKGKKFFEVSSSAGMYLKKASDCGAECFGLDIAWDLLDETLNKVPMAQLYLSKLEDFDFPEMYDYILCASSFHYYNHKDKIIGKIAKACKTFIIETPINNSEKDDMHFVTKGISIPSKSLLLKWLTSNFKTVDEIGFTNNEGINYGDSPTQKRIVLRCQG